MPYIIEREERGIRVDIDAAERAQRHLTGLIAPLQGKLNQMCKFEVNVNSNAGKDSHMKRIFEPRQEGGKWFANNGEPLGTASSGGPSLARDVLQALSHPAAKLIVELRGLYRLRDTFLGQHVLGHAINGRVYPRINQNKGEDGGTGTGRLSYVDPALQQIPARDKFKSSIIRPTFLPEEGHKWVDTDKASFEVRVFASLVGAKNPAIVDRFKQDRHTDFHQYVSDLCGIPRNMPAEGGANGKQLNLSIIFTQGEGATAEKMGLPWHWDSFLPKGKADKPENYIHYKKPGPEAKAVIEKYHANVPGVREFSNRAKEKALERGFVFTQYGRRLRFPNGFKAYKASGLIIQSTAADWNKENWKLIHEALDGEGEMLLNIHDGYGLSIEEGREEEVARRVKDHVEQSPRSRVPLILEISHPGANWWDSYSSGVWIK
jgi:DNA polymerase I-like protein with 3'-5' exonuclease and polymerase domains